MLSAALSGVWPPSKPMQRRLVARQFVPTAEAEQQQGSGAGSAGEGKADAAAAAAAGAAAGSSGGESVGPSSSSGASKDEGPSTSAAAAQQAEAEGEGEGQATEEAAALAAALEQQCPDLTPVDVEKAALCLRLFLGCRAVGEQASDGPSFQVGMAGLELRGSDQLWRAGCG